MYEVQRKYLEARKEMSEAIKFSKNHTDRRLKAKGIDIIEAYKSNNESEIQTILEIQENADEKYGWYEKFNAVIKAESDLIDWGKKMSEFMADDEQLPTLQEVFTNGDDSELVNIFLKFKKIIPCP